jgi:hypothetical protein
MDIEKELKEKEAAVPSLGKLTPPTMAAGTVGPKEPPGPKGPVGGYPIAPGPAPNKEDKAKRARIAQLDAHMVLRVELLSTKKKLADADERMGLLAVQDARQRKQELDKEESLLMREVSQQIGAAAGNTITLVDKARGLCKVE